MVSLVIFTQCNHIVYDNCLSLRINYVLVCAFKVFDLNGDWWSMIDNKINDKMLISIYFSFFFYGNYYFTHMCDKFHCHSSASSFSSA